MKNVSGGVRPPWHNHNTSPRGGKADPRCPRRCPRRTPHRFPGAGRYSWYLEVGGCPVWARRAKAPSNSLGIIPASTPMRWSAHNAFTGWSSKLSRHLMRLATFSDCLFPLSAGLLFSSCVCGSRPHLFLTLHQWR